MNLNNNEQEIPEVQLEEYALKLDAKEFCMPKKRPKPNHKDENLPALSRRTVPIGRRDLN